MSALHFRLPEAELAILWRYFDGVSHALAQRFVGGSSTGEENLTFLLCELLDEGMTSLHMLEYPLAKAKEDLASADGGITLDVSFQTHEHTKHVENKYSGADLGVVFVLNHSHFGRSETAVLLQAKRLIPAKSKVFTLNSSFSNFEAGQRDFLKDVEKGFSVRNSIFYLWYSPASDAFSDDDAKLIRSLEATAMSGAGDPRDFHPLVDDMIEFGWPWHNARRTPNSISSEDDDRERAWRLTQPATRVSSLSVVDQLTTSGRGPSLISLYNIRASRTRRRWRDHFAFEPFAELFLMGLVPGRIGHSSKDWLRLARGEKVPMPPSIGAAKAVPLGRDTPDIVPAPRHSLTITLRSSLPWPENLPRPE